MAGTSAEGEEANLSHPTPEGDLVSLMAQMISDLKRDLKQDFQEEVKGSEGRIRAIQNTLVGALKEARASRSVTPKSDHLHLQASGIEHVVSRGNGGYKEHVEEGGYEDWQEEVEGGNMRSRDEDGRYGRFGMGNVSRRPFGGGNGGYGRFGEGNRHGGMEPYGDRFRRDRYYEEEVPYRGRLRPTHQHVGVGPNQMGTPSSHLTTPSSLHFSHEPIVVYGNVPSSMSLNQISREKEREKEKRLESESESKKPRERVKRQECEVQKSRESGGGERREKYQIRENPQAQVSKGCLLDSKANLGWAPNEPLPLALGEENTFLPTNTTCMSSCVDDFVVSKVEDMEVKHQVAQGLETMPPEKDQEERGQVDELLAQGSSSLSLPSCDGPLDIIVLEKPIHFDKFDIDDLCDKLPHELESFHVKSTLASYIDPFLISPSIDGRDISLVKFTLNVGVTSFRAKMPKFSFVGNFELHEYVDENSRTKRSDMDSDFRTWCLLCFQCKVVKPFNGIGVFYGRFVKDFSTHMSLVDCVVFNGLRIHCFHSCGLKLLEQLCGAYFDKFLS